MAKKMIINSAVCDARKVTEQTLSSYESIVINSSLLLTNERVRELFAKYPVSLNCADTCDIEGDVHVSTVNGSSHIAAGDRIPEGKQYMIVNGTLKIDAGTENILDTYVGMTVNGTVSYPESLSVYMSRAHINGTALTYPDDAVILDSTAVIDRVFALRAKNCKYWSRRRMILVDPKLDPALLHAKGAVFQTKQAIIADSKLDGLIDLIDEQADIVVVPDGTAVVRDDLTLDGTAIKRYGTMLYVIGDLKVTEENRAALESTTYLNIRGNAIVDESLRDLLLEKAEHLSGTIKSPRGRVISDQLSAKISRWLLEKEPKGISVTDCVTVKIDTDIPNDLILERLHLSDCVSVTCSEEQEAAVGAVSEDVVQIGRSSFGGIGNLVENAMNAAFGDSGPENLGDLLSVKMVNNAHYVM